MELSWFFIETTLLRTPNQHELARNGKKEREAANKEKLLARMGRNDAEVYEFIKEKGKVSRSLISSEFKMPDRTVLNCLKGS